MRTFVLSVLATALTFAVGAAVAQTSTAEPIVVAQSARMGKLRVAAPAAKPAAADAGEQLSITELALAKNVYTGTIPCAMGADVTITEDKGNPGFFNVTTGKETYHMHPVVSRTGAMRLEDPRAGAMWLQLGNKSMLLNQKLGRRVADDCAAPAQVKFAAHMKEGPAVKLLDP